MTFCFAILILHGSHRSYPSRRRACFSDGTPKTPTHTRKNMKVGVMSRLSALTTDTLASCALALILATLTHFLPFIKPTSWGWAALRESFDSSWFGFANLANSILSYWFCFSERFVLVGFVSISDLIFKFEGFVKFEILLISKVIFRFEVVFIFEVVFMFKVIPMFQVSFT